MGMILRVQVKRRRRQGAIRRRRRSALDVYEAALTVVLAGRSRLLNIPSAGNASASYRQRRRQHWSHIVPCDCERSLQSLKGGAERVRSRYDIHQCIPSISVVPGWI